MRSLKIVPVLLLLAALGVTAKDVAQSPTTAPAVANAPPSHLGAALLGDDGLAVPGVSLSRLDMQTVVHGNLAQATFTLTFANSTPRVLGGNLVFPLPEDATVTGYGLEINGVMVDGVAVEKERARIIYDSEIHRRVDPGLVENVEANTFRTRLFPIPPNGARSIRIEFTTQIEQGPDGPALKLPAVSDAVLDEATMRISAPEAAAAPVVRGEVMEGLKFEKSPQGFAASASAKKVRLGHDLSIAFPDLPTQWTAVERRLVFARTVEEMEARPQDDHAANLFENYFVVTDSPVAPPRPPTMLKNHRVGVVWDASLSRADVDHSRELKLLRTLLEHLGRPETDLIVLRNDVEIQPQFPGAGNGVDRLIEAVAALHYDGGTNLSSLMLPRNLNDYPRTNKKNAAVADYDLFLVFTDGFGTLGGDRPARAEAPVYAISDEQRVNSPLLRAMCRESGGSFYNLSRTSDEQVVREVGDATFSLVSVECNPAEIAEVYPPVGTPVTGRFTLAGKLLAPQARLTLHYGFGKDIVASQTFTLTADGVREGSLIPRYWAQQKSTALAQFPEKNAAELEQLGKQFNLVTPKTSLLVLESVDQYVMYRVLPPSTRPDVYREFLARIEQSHQQEAKSREQKLAETAVLWNARVEWWNKQYAYPANLKVNVEGGKPGDPVAAAPASAPSGDLAPAATVSSSVPRQQAQPPRSLSYDAAARPRTAADPQNLQRLASVADGRPAGVDADRSVEGLEKSAFAEERRGQAFRNLGGQAAQVAPTADQGAVVVIIKPWDPNTPYIAAMKAVPSDQAYDVYLAQRKNYAASPAFYLDCADYLLSIDQRKAAVRVLTDIVELELHDARLIRVTAHRLNQIGERDLAIDLFEKTLALRPEEPQSYRDLALALSDRADALTAPAAGLNQEKVDAAVSDYTRALELLNKVVLGNWPRFPEVELPVLMEANAIVARVQRLPGVHDFHNPLDARLVKNLECDVRVVMTWDADQTDIDLWVTEPSGEKCFYGHNRTVIGGLLSHDFTDGYGPEEYCLRKLMPGAYLVQANFFGSRQQELTGPATVQATVITNFGRRDEKRQALTLRLKDARDVVDIGTVTLGDAK